LTVEDVFAVAVLTMKGKVISSLYRFRAAKTNEWLWLKTCSMSFQNPYTEEVEYIVCTNTMASKLVFMMVYSSFWYGCTGYHIWPQSKSGQIFLSGVQIQPQLGTPGKNKFEHIFVV